MDRVRTAVELEAGRLNFEWARAVLLALVEECGIEEIQIAPGSRSAPLVLAAGSIEGLEARVHLDERCAGFFALGYGRARSRPTAVVTTSGTAVANLLPAVVEADLDDVPVLLVTADRPAALRGMDANQTIVQPGIFGARVRCEVDLPLPTAHDLGGARPRSVLADVRRAARSALGPPPGPVHVNVQFDKPLQPQTPGEAGLSGGAEASGGAGDPSRRAATAALGRGGFAAEGRGVSGDEGCGSGGAGRTGQRGRGPARVASLASLAVRLDRARRPLLVAGPSSDPVRDGPAIARFAAARGIPALVDPLSGARFHPLPEAVRPSPLLGGGDHFLRVDQVVRRHVPDLVIRTGRTPTSAALEAALAAWSGAHQIVIDAGAHRKDHQRLAGEYVEASAADVLPALAGAGTPREPIAAPPASDWLRRWTDLEAATWAALAESPPDAAHEGDCAAAVLRALPAGAALFVSSSMPVRDVDAYARPAPSGVRVFGNRGASGIDGIVSSALGCAAGGATPLVVLVGDIAFYHDMNGLLATRDRSLDVTFVVVDNDGGGIFHMLPIREFEPAFTPFFATPHGLDFRHAARLYDLPFTDAASIEALQDAVADAVRKPGSQVIRVRTDRDVNRLRHEASRRRVARRLTSTLNQDSSP